MSASSPVALDEESHSQRLARKARDAPFLVVGKSINFVFDLIMSLFIHLKVINRGYSLVILAGMVVSLLI